MLESSSFEILKLLFQSVAEKGDGVDAKKFRADNHENFSTIKKLEETGYIYTESTKYYPSLKSIYELCEAGNIKAEQTLHLIKVVYGALIDLYLTQQESKILVNIFSEKIDLPKRKVSLALQYLVQVHPFRSWHSNFSQDNAYFSVAEEILQEKDLEALISKNTKPVSNPPTDQPLPEKQAAAHPTSFIDYQRIHELTHIKSNKFDLRRVIKICEELNRNMDNENYFSVACLSRILIDHIPPIFSCQSFSDVSNTYKGGKSFKESMQHLENSMRKISDSLLHQQIRRKESLPTKTMVNFSADIDVLLAETIRLLEEHE